MHFDRLRNLECNIKQNIFKEFAQNYSEVSYAILMYFDGVTTGDIGLDVTEKPFQNLQELDFNRGMKSSLMAFRAMTNIPHAAPLFNNYNVVVVPWYRGKW